MNERLVDGRGVIQDAIAALRASLMERRVCIDEAEAQDIAEACMFDVWQQYAGQTVYIRKAMENLTSERDLRMFADYRAGVSIIDLVRRYKLSDGHVYRVIRRLEQLAAPDQPSLFD